MAHKLKTQRQPSIKSFKSFQLQFMYYLRLSGSIPDHKQLEFEQTYRFAATQIPGTCKNYVLSKDVLKEGIYHFTSYWETLETLHLFTHSSVFMMLIGAYNTLGLLLENTKGEFLPCGN